MQIAPPHASEAQRLQALRSLEILDTAAEERFDRLTELVAITLDVPIALVSLVDEDRQWFKSNHGISVRETHRDLAFCAHAIVGDSRTPLVVDDAALDPRFADNPLVADDPHIRFYAGQVLLSSDGHPVGTLCAIDRTPRTLDESQQRALVHLAALVEEELEGQRAARHSIQVATSEQNKSLILRAVGEGLVLHDHDGTLLDWNPAAEKLLGLTRSELDGRTGTDSRFVITYEDGGPMEPGHRPSEIAMRTGRRVQNVICKLERPRTDPIWLNVSAEPIVNASGVLQVVSTFSDVTTEVEERRARRRLEQAIHRQARRTQASLDALDQGVILSDADGNISVANAATERILGFTAAEITQMWQSGQWPSFDQDGALLAFEDRPTAKALTTGEPVSGELVHWRTKSGAMVLLRVTCIPGVDVGTDEADANGMVVAFTDVTEGQLSRQLLDVTLEMAPAGIAILGVDGVVTRCNPAFAENAGRPADEIVGLHAVDLIHGAIRHAPRSSVEELFGGQANITSFDHRVYRPDRAERWAHTQVNVVNTSMGSIAIVSTFDITERRQLLRDVTRSNHLIERSNDMILVVDETGSIQYSSPATTRILGASGENLRDLYDPIHPDDVERAASSIARLMSSDRPGEPFTARTRTTDGRWLHIEYVGVNMMDVQAVGGILITGRDVTQRVELTDQLTHQAHHDPLTKLVNREVLHRELDRALADRSDRRVGVCYFDLDGFKAINDRFGHATGDVALQRVADALRGCLRSSDIAARVGGDEFVVVLDPVTGRDEALECAERFRAAVMRIATTDGLDGLGVSVGVIIDRSGDDATSMLARADTAMYRAKARGGSVVAGSIDPDAAEALRQGVQPLRLS